MKAIIKYFGKLERYLFVLIVITLFNAFLGENFSSATFVSFLVAITLTFKGFLVIDHFMELKNANKNLRFLMRLYFIIFPSLIIISELLSY